VLNYLVILTTLSPEFIPEPLSSYGFVSPSTLWWHDILEKERASRFLPLFIAQETRKIRIITAA